MSPESPAYKLLMIRNFLIGFRKTLDDRICREEQEANLQRGTKKVLDDAVKRIEGVEKDLAK